MGKGRSDNHRLKLFRLLDYLLENTDENHTVKTSQIIEHMDNLGIPVEQKTVWSDLRILQDYGIEIEYDGRSRGYRILEREFDLQELQLLIDSVQSSRFITQRKAKKLTDKLKAHASCHERQLLERRSYVTNRVRSMNDSVFYHIDDLHAAIANDWKISFRYYYFNRQKKKEYFKTTYIVSPYALLWNDNNYYLLAFHQGKMKHFRVDRMDGIDVVYEQRDGKKEFSAMKLTDRSLKVFSMYSGKERTVQMRFANHLASVVLDRFGQDVILVPNGDKHFTLTVSVEVSPQFYGWLCGLGKGVRILAPSDVVEAMGAYVRGIAEMY